MNALSAVLALVITLAGVEPSDPRLPSVLSPPQADTIETHHIVDAMLTGMVGGEIVGAGLSAVRVSLTRNTPRVIRVIVPAGTFFANRRDAVQSMLATRDVVLDLIDETEATDTIPVACANAEKAVPYGSSTFDVMYSPESEELLRLAEAIDAASPSREAAQVAVWIVTDDLSRRELNDLYRRGTTLESRPAAALADVLAAMEVVEEAGIALTQKRIWTEGNAPLFSMVSDDPGYWEFAARFLGIQGLSRLEFLVAALRHEHPEYAFEAHSAAVGALRRWDDPRAVEPLIEALSDAYPGVRYLAREALMEREDSLVVEPLIATLVNDSEDARNEAAAALQRITGQDFGVDQARWREWWERNRGSGARH